MITFIILIIIIIIIFIALKEKPQVPKKVNNYRDIPFDGDLIMAYYLGHREKLMTPTGLFSAYLLKWINENKIKLVFDAKVNYIDITNLKDFTEPTDILLSTYLQSIAIDNKITIDNYKENIQTNYNEIHNWAYQVEIMSKKKLIQHGYLIQKENSYKCDYTDKALEKATQLKGLKQFLKSMSLINEKNTMEVHLWKEYLIYAAAFNITDVIKDQLHDFYPKLYIKIDRGDF